MGSMRWAAPFAALIALSPGAARAQSGEVVAPYFYVIVDTSGSMSATGVANSCGQPTWRLNAAKCVLNDLINAYGDVQFGLAQFNMECAQISQPGPDPWVYLADCTPSDGANSVSADRGETLVPIGPDNHATLLSYIDFLPDYPDDMAQSCPGTADPLEILVNNANYGLTPLAGTLRTAKRYFEGDDPDFGTSPAESDAFFGCRPYYVILLTDGDETCAFGTSGSQATNNRNAVVAAADELRSTVIPGVGTVDIRTYVIGFGISDPDTDIEAIADAGGTEDGFYASNETELALAFSQIIEDSLLIEVCDGVDNDCDGDVDEGFVKYCNIPGGITMPLLCTNPGDPCNGADDNCFAGTTDEVTNACGTCGPAPMEICDTLDNDCDGFIDEGGVCGGCTPEPEICDGKDNDCDGRFDEGITRPCGSDVGVCTPGMQTCIEQPMEAMTGTWGPCSGIPPGPEMCNGMDDDCDGIVDGITRECYEFATGCTIGVGCMGICQLGTELCSGGGWGDCVGDVGPATEICNGLDDDCDGMIDEGDPGGGIPCGSSCGVGVTECVGGMIVCTGGSGAMDEECNGFDDDCDGMIDEDIPPMGPCMEDELCVPGQLECVAGSFQCVGGVPPEIEACDCEDNDCDGETDEGSLCGGGSTCLGQPYCQCALPCAEGEFPCPLGYMCVQPEDTTDRFCVPDPCYGVSCQAGEVCDDGACVPVCDTVMCPAPLVCRPTDGTCVPDNCYGFPERCADTEFCVLGECVTDACAGVECADDEFCRDGACVDSCAGIVCPDGQSCRDGACVADPCADAECTGFQTCDPATGECVDDECSGVACPPNTVCDPLTGECVEDPCLGVTCPPGQECADGDCWDPGQIDQPDAGPPPDNTYVTAAGGGCTSCAAGGGAPGGAAWLLALGVLVALRRRRAR